MKTDELKAFIEGIEHGFQDGRPTKEQWEAIKAKIEKLGQNRSDLPSRPLWPPLPIVGPGVVPQPDPTHPWIQPFSMAGKPLTASFGERKGV